MVIENFILLKLSKGNKVSLEFGKYNSYWPEQEIPVSLVIYLTTLLFSRGWVCIGLYNGFIFHKMAM